MSTLKRSERNSIIEDYRNGVLNPNYEVIQTKTKGRYTLRKRKVPLTDEQLEQLSAIDDNDDSSIVQHTQQPIKPPVKRSKKENSLFDLQNQLNTQMLYRLNELTNKVIKLKAWKKKMKQDLSYEEDDNMPENSVSQVPESEAVSAPEQPESVSQQPKQPESVSHAYLEQIPQEYIEQQYISEPLGEPTYLEQQQQQSYEPTYMYGARGGIDYSKFGF